MTPTPPPPPKRRFRLLRWALLLAALALAGCCGPSAFLWTRAWLRDRPEPHFFLGDYDAIKRDYLPDDYRRDAASHNVLKTVHCEAEWDRDDQVGETAWLTEINARHGMPHAIVAHAWFHTPNAAEEP